VKHSTAAVIAVLAVAVLVLGGNQLYQAGKQAGARQSPPTAVRSASPDTGNSTQSSPDFGPARAELGVPSAGSPEDIVHATRSGKHYHRAGCRYLAKSDIPMTRKEAEAKGLTPCSVCNP
jgi:hypothetical protein